MKVFSADIFEQLHKAQLALHAKSRDNYITPDGRCVRNIDEVKRCLELAIQQEPLNADLRQALSTAYIFDRNVDRALLSLRDITPPVAPQ